MSLQPELMPMRPDRAPASVRPAVASLRASLPPAPPAREHPASPSVRAFRAFVAAVDRGDIRQTIACQHELRRHGFGVFGTASRHAPPVRPRRAGP